MALNGTPAADTLSARFDRDAVYGFGGRDVLSSSGYNDTYLDGGADNDRLTSSFDLALLPDVDEARLVLTQNGGAGNDALSVSLYGDDNNTSGTLLDARLNLTGGGGIDTVTATIGGSVRFFNPVTSIWGGAGDDSLSVVEGDVETFFSHMKQTIRAGEGNDRVTIRTYGAFPHVANTVYGEGGNDTIFADAVGYTFDSVTEASANNQISGGDGDDLIQVRAHGIYDAYTAVGSNVVSGDGGNDTIQAESWNHNELTGGAGHDAIVATLTQDFDLSQLSSNNILDGGAGNDFLSATGRVNRWSEYEDGPGVLTNRLTGGTGNDTLQASAFIDDLGSGGSARNVLLANDGNDTLVATIQAGRLGSNRLFGHDGNDRLQVNGGEGNLLNAGQGRDVLVGGFGGDTFVGGGGIDTFVFSSEAGGADVISDFGRDDRIAVTGLVDRGAPGLLNDLVAAVDTVTQASPGAPVDVRFDDGATLRFHLIGVAGAVNSITDFITAGQIVDANLFV